MTDQTSHQQYIVAASEAYQSHDPGMYPAQKVAVVTCMDTRIDTLNGFGLSVGDAHILRNAGGRVTEDVVRSLILSSAVLGVTEVAVLQHTKCGVGAPESDLREKVRDSLGQDPSHVVFHGFSSVTESINEDVQKIRSNPLLNKIERVWGGLIDIDTHSVTVLS